MQSRYSWTLYRSTFCNIFEASLSPSILTLREVRRNKAKTFDEILHVIREADSFITDNSTEGINLANEIRQLRESLGNKNVRTPQLEHAAQITHREPRFCTFCKRTGHTIDHCWSRANRNGGQSGRNYTGNFQNYGRNNFSRERGSSYNQRRNYSRGNSNQQRFPERRFYPNNPTFTCYRCFGNHRSRDCTSRFPKNTNPELVPKCAICGKIGHFSANHDQFAKNGDSRFTQPSQRNRPHNRDSQKPRFGGRSSATGENVNNVELVKPTFQVLTCDVGILDCAFKATLDTGATRSLIN